MQAYHTLVAGPSGGGKTTRLRQMHAEYKGCSIFLTPKSNERKAQHDPPARIRNSSAHYPADVEKARQWAAGRDETVQIIVDEAQNCPSFRDADGADGPVRDGLHEDRDKGIKWVLATQNPQDLRTNANNYGPIQQCRWFVWVGESRTWHSGFRDWLQLDPEQLPDEDYEVAVIEPSDPPRVIHRTRTEKVYA